MTKHRRSKRVRRRWWLYGLTRLLLVVLVLSIGLVLPFAWLSPPTSSTMLQTYFARRAYAPEATGPAYAYQWTSYADMSAHLPLAIIAAEDQRFPAHYGFDLTEIQRALRDHFQGKNLRGASTITQQVAKNLYLWSDRSLLRKGLEAWFTILLESLWSKRRILEVYLNIAQFGVGIFGVGAASQHYFGKPPTAVTAEEAALLAAVLPGPAIYRVDQPSQYVRQRQKWILQHMRQLGGVRYLDKL